MSSRTRETQTILHSLGWPLVVDGVEGPVTKAAVMDFQEMYLLERLVVDGIVGPMTQKAMQKAAANDGRISLRFKTRDFQSKGNGWIKALGGLVLGLEMYSARLGRKVRLTSTYRDPVYNSRLGGAERSQHMWGAAADIAEEDRFDLSVLKGMGLFSGLGVVGATGQVLHVDVRHLTRAQNFTGGTQRNPTVWVYS